jgi:hypothetical protein
MPQYIFTNNEQDNSFPDRYRVIDVDEDADFLCKNENLTGTVLKTDTIEFIDKLLERYQSNESIVTEMVDVPYWKFVELRFNPAEAEKAAKGKPPVL